MNKTIRIFIALFCLSTQITLSSDAQQVTPTEHINNPFARIMQQPHLSDQQRIAAMNGAKRAIMREFRRKFSSSDAALLTLSENLDNYLRAALQDFGSNKSDN